MSNRTIRRTVAALGAATLALGLAACGDSDEARDRPAAVETARNGDEFNQADVDFATAMIPHHAQAVQMANLAEDRPLPAELRTLVDGVHATQVAEVETMVTWLTDWGQEIPETSMDHVNAGHGSTGDMGHGATDPTMPGMMSAARMAALAKCSDAEFPRRWMTMMIEHHRGAIEMAEDERRHGHFPDAVALAEAVVTTQRAEVTTLEELLGRR